MGIYRPTNLTATENTPDEAALLEDLASILREGGSQVTVVPEIQRVKFGKNMWNAVLGASAALARESLRAFFRPPECEPGYDSASVDSQSEAGSEGGERSEPQTESERRTADVPRAAPALGQYTIPLLYDTLQELSALSKALFASPDNPDGPVEGLDPEVAYKTLSNTARIHARPDSKHLPSMLVDVEAGRPLEVEHVVGEVVRMGRKVGVAMPVRLLPSKVARRGHADWVAARSRGWRRSMRSCSSSRIRHCVGMQEAPERGRSYDLKRTRQEYAGRKQPT